MLCKAALPGQQRSAARPCHQIFEGRSSSQINQAAVLDSGTEAKLSFSLEDEEGLSYYQISINGVPLYEGKGEPVSGKKVELCKTVLLLEGENQIEVSAFNTKGQESLRALYLLSTYAWLRHALIRRGCCI